jgi:CheY-like chemotaxis protein
MSRILVVEDDQAVRTDIQAILQLNGFDVVVAKHGRNDIEAAGAFDMVIVDIFAGGLDGLETIRTVHKRAPNVPIIAMSGLMFRDAITPAPDFLGMATKLGAACSLAKPFRPDDLLRAVRSCLPDLAPLLAGGETRLAK